MAEERAIGGEIPPEQAKREMQAGLVLTTRDGAERAMLYKGTFASWLTGGPTRNILLYLADFTGWYVMERGDFLRETATKDNTDTSRINKSFFE